MDNLQALHLEEVIVAIGGLGTAAFGLVDAAKGALPFINRIGLKRIHRTIISLTPEGNGRPLNALPQVDILATVEANWVNGMDLSAQKAVAKSLIKLHLNAANAALVASRANVDATDFAVVVGLMETSGALTQGQKDLYARFDLILTALLDETFQLSDQHYRNQTRILAALVAIVLAVVGGYALIGSPIYWQSRDILLSILVGLLATPLAPIAKDLSSALATAVNAMQVIKK